MTNVVKLWKDNLESHHKLELVQVKSLFPKKNVITININNTAPELFDEIVKDPILAENSLYAALMEGRYIPQWNGSKHSINIRFVGFPKKTKVNELNSSYLEKFCSFRVVVKKVTTVKPRLVHAAFKCNACKDRIVFAPVDDEEVVTPGDKCLCGGKSWRFLLKQSIKKDYQLIQVQDPPEDGAGTKPETLTVKLLDDLTSKVQPGNIIIINGIYRGKQKKNSATLETYLDAKSIEVKNKDFSKIEITEAEIEEFKEMAKDPEIYDKLWNSVGGVIKGYESAKQAILLQLFGGVEKITEDGDKFRADFHVLLAGDPSVAKSKLLKAAFNLCPRGVYASGKATTAAGLTAAANKGADGSWEIEAGAAVLANGGMLFLDELDKIDKDAVASLHEIAEEQVLHINKAGISMDLPTRESLTAACNPKRSRFDRYQDLASQVNFPASLLSRFGLVFLLLDEPDAKKDRGIAKHIISCHRGTLSNNKIPIEKLRRFIAYAKQTSFPVISDDAAAMYEDYYCKIRGQSQGAIPITPRQIEDIIRMSEASAKTRLSESVTKVDVDRAIFIYEDAMRMTGTDPVTGKVDADRMSGNMSQSTRDDLAHVRRVRDQYHAEMKEWPAKAELVILMEKEGLSETDARTIVQKLYSEMQRIC